MANAVQQAANVRGAFEITTPPPPGTGVLLDDQRISGWTLAMVGGQLRRAGAQAVVPVVLATLSWPDPGRGDTSEALAPGAITHRYVTDRCALEREPYDRFLGCPA